MIQVLSSGMVGKYELLMGVVDALPEKGLLEKATTID